MRQRGQNAEGSAAPGTSSATAAVPTPGPKWPALPDPTKEALPHHSAQAVQAEAQADVPTGIPQGLATLPIRSAVEWRDTMDDCDTNRTRKVVQLFKDHPADCTLLPAGDDEGDNIIEKGKPWKYTDDLRELAAQREQEAMFDTEHDIPLPRSCRD